MKKKCVFVVFLSLCLPLMVSAENGTQSVDELASLLALDLEKLGQVQVFTAERKLSPIEEAPSVVSVITAEQIKRQGLKSLSEVLSRVPGFFNATSPFMEPISNRGFVQNVNTNYLLLVDGHALNNDAINGLGHSHMMPGLDRIARIEIVRGPGSTLWGANAAMGIIHLITKNAGDLDNGDSPLGSLDVSYDYEFNHQRHIAQATYGKQFDEGGIMLSGKFFNSDPNSTTSFQAGATDFEVQADRQMNLWNFDDSHDLYAKLDWRGWMLKAGKIRFKNKNPLFTPIDGSTETTWTTEKEWIEIGKTHDLKENFSLEYKLFYDKFSDKRSTQFLTAEQTNPSKSEGFGGETILHFRNEDHHFLLGISASNRDLKTKTVQNFTSGVVQSFIGIPNIVDKNRAIFFEENYRGFDDWIFTVGLRVDRNTPRGNKTNYLPRAAVSYSINNNWSAKYAFNTGYVAPTLQQTRGGIFQPFGPGGGLTVKGAENNQKSRSHDMQLFYKDGRTHANLTLFYHTLTNVIQFAGFGPVTVDGIPDVTIFEFNASDMNTWGLELEAKTMLTDWLDVYGNYAFANAKYANRFASFEGQVVLDLVDDTSVATQNLTVTGTPQHIWNLGLDWQIKNNFTLNAHYRAWSNAFSKRSNQPSFKRFGVNQYFDLNLHYQEQPNKGLNAAVYVKNLFDNDDPLPGGVNSGQVVPQNGRQVGLRIGYLF
jgi:outer membrane receptor for ferrienterochelin and colicin